MSTDAAGLLRLYARDEKAPELIDSARTRLRLALTQLDAGEHCRHPGEQLGCTFPACPCGLLDGWRL